ncbi:MAG: methyltransferase domain-containing protein [Candidatus Abyssobacteria bacterium SURF_17]|jgi:demethylmenaquinone methyltransferase/2-methoxy-6-polyprenyl-1,4-benzoquinol methylase|uniref:Methyltransferase domain-containing protein n=1 Tax=Candidatus Abyssobacteria bacterium SURF_17 TaxID=2093361 RepID=A0A419EWZ7_9BACT|nr:MAG: methyltransferase domain-containing protein [Candidatus Abyssubacteria bacterium SURF_17]
MAIPTTTDIIHLYNRRAKRYNFTANLYYLIGFREQAYRKLAVKRLNLKPGDTVVEIGCGTGLNFPLLQQAVGIRGRIIGVDLTDAMLAQAGRRVAENKWSNVELVQSDAASFHFPDGVDGIISTFALTLVPEFDQVIKNGVDALSPGKRWVVLDFKLPSNRLAWLAPLGIFITSPFGVTRDLANRHPWESIEKYLTRTSFEELYAGFAYIATGEKRGNS